MTAATTLLIGMSVGALVAQQAAPPAQPAAPQPYFVGNRLGMPMNPAPDGAFTPMTSSVKVYGAIYSAESCSYDPARGVPDRHFDGHQVCVYADNVLGADLLGLRRSAALPDVRLLVLRAAVRRRVAHRLHPGASTSFRQARMTHNTTPV